MPTNFAERAYNHSFPFDPIVRYLSDTDFYKLLMLQFIWAEYPNLQNTFKVTNRTKSVRLGELIDIVELRSQLEHVRTLKWTNQELNYLKAQEFYGKRDLFSNGFIDYLSKTWKLSDYTIDIVDGQVELIFSGSWVETTMWEIYALTIINEMRNRVLMKGMKRSELDIMYAQAKVKLFKKMQRLQTLPDLKFADFGTRRRHSFLWQEHAALTAAEQLGDKFVGTSNVYIAMKHGFNAIGTNAHELPMTLAGLAKDADNLRHSQYEVCQRWQNRYRGGLLVFLPDTFGTTQFLKNAPQWLANWRGARPDSKAAIAGGEELIQYWREQGQNPKEKLIVFSDGLDVRIDGFEPKGEDIKDIYDHFNGQVGISFGMGTMLTNDFIGCHPTEPDRLKAISLVCKVDTVEGRPAVKLSDNYEKATSSDPAEVERYRAVFGHDGMDNAPVNV